MKNIFKLLLISSITLLISCEKTLYIDVPDNDPKLVAQSFISPSSKYIDVYLSWSKPIYSEYDWRFDDEKNADVYIVKNGVKTKLTYVKPGYQEENSYYRVDASSLGISIGDSIKLEVKAPNDVKINAGTKIPGKAVYELKVDKFDTVSGEYYNYLYTFVFKAKNNDSINYYRISAKGYISINSGNQQIIDSVNLYNVSEHNMFYKIKENKSIILKYGSYEKYDSLKILVLHTDEAYFNYHNSVYNFDGDNPFAEPVIVYSNINGGLGVFCSYTQSSKVFKF